MVLYQSHKLSDHFYWLKSPTTALFILQLEQLVIKINALYLAILPTYKVDHLINETGIRF